MTKKIFIPIAFTYLFVATSYTTKTSPEDKIVAQLKQEIVQDLTENILPFWVKHSPDPAGGFYGTLNFDGTPKADAIKGGILNARLIWTFSAAYRLLKDEHRFSCINTSPKKMYFCSLLFLFFAKKIIIFVPINKN